MALSIKTQLERAALFLRQFPNPRLEAEALLMYVLNKDRVWLKTHDQTTLNPIQWFLFEFYCWQRSRGVPLAYIRGYQDWHGQKFLVNRAVLIPRDETETLLRHIIDTGTTPEKILDIGTGSGCLAIELKRAHSHAEVTGLDISTKALQVARKNTKILTQDVTFKNSDLLSAVPTGSQFDLIVANLPYVPTTMTVSPDVNQEPATAIFSGADGLDHIRRLAQELTDKNIQFDQLWLEFLPSQKDSINKIFKNYTVEFKPDVAGNLFFAQIS